MIRGLITAGIALLSAAAGLIVASLIVGDFHVGVSGFIIAVVVYTVIQAILTPFIMSSSEKHAPAFLGGAGLITAFLALLVASFFPGGIQITSIGGWVFGTLVVWLVGALGSWLLPMFWLRNKVRTARAK